MNNNSNDGIYLYINCKDNTISGNTANDNDDNGIYLYINCKDNTISGNTANDNDDNGIYILNNCKDNTISGNTANDNDDNGIYILNNCDNNNITGNYIYFNQIQGIIIGDVACGVNTIKKNVLVSADENYYNDDGTDTIIGCNLYLTSAPSLCVDIVNQSFSTTEFVVTINISSGFNIFSDYNFDFTIESIQMWWNGDIIPTNDIIELGFGSYKVSLTPIFVQPGGDPILFNMTIIATHHGDKYFELDLAVDPKAVSGITHPPTSGDDDDDDDGKHEENLLLMLGIVSVISAISAVSVISAILMKKRLKLKRQN